MGGESSLFLEKVSLSLGVTRAWGASAAQWREELQVPPEKVSRVAAGWMSSSRDIAPGLADGDAWG